MKKITVLLALIFCVQFSIGQINDNGSVDGPMTTAQINAFPSPLLGQTIYNSETLTDWQWNGTAWADTGSGSGSSDHGALTGLSDDDHSQYHTDARAQAWLAALYGDLDIDGTDDVNLTGDQFGIAGIKEFLSLRSYGLIIEDNPATIGSTIEMKPATFSPFTVVNGSTYARMWFENDNSFALRAPGNTQNQGLKIDFSNVSAVRTITMPDADVDLSNIGSGTNYIDDSAADDGPAILAALSSGGAHELDPNGTYATTSLLEIPAGNPWHLEMNGNTITGTSQHMLRIRNSASISNGTFETTFDSGADGSEAIDNLLGVVYAINDSFDYLNFKDFTVKAPNANINGIKIDITISGYLKEANLINVNIEEVGRMGVEIISHTLSNDPNQYIENVHIENLVTKNTGTKNTLYGQSLSLSGNMRKATVNGFYFDTFKDIAFENRTLAQLNVLNGQIKNPSSINDRFLFSNSDLINPYDQNRNISFTNIETVGDGRIELNSNLNTIQVDNLTTDGAVTFYLDDTHIKNSTLKTDGIIQATGGRVTISETDVELGATNSWFDTENTNTVLELNKVNLVKTGTTQSAIVDVNTTMNIIDSNWDGGYIDNSGALTTGIFKYTNGNNGTFFGTGSHTFFETYVDGQELYKDYLQIDATTADSSTIFRLNGSDGQIKVLDNGRKVQVRNADDTGFANLDLELAKLYVKGDFDIENGKSIRSSGATVQIADDLNVTGVISGDGSGLTNLPGGSGGSGKPLVKITEAQEATLTAQDKIDNNYVVTRDVGSSTISGTLSVNTVADLKAYSTVVGDVVWTQGYYTKFDYPGYPYYYDASITTGDNGGTVLKSDVLTGSWIMMPQDYYTLDMYGAILDWNADGSHLATHDAAMVAIVNDPEVYTIHVPYQKQYGFSTPLILDNKRWDVHGRLRYDGPIDPTVTAITVRFTSTGGFDPLANSHQHKINLMMGINGSNDQWGWTPPADYLTAKDGYSSWTENTSLVGLKIEDGDSNTWNLSVRGFDTGLLVESASLSSSFNVFNLAQMLDNRIGVYLYGSNLPADYNNENTFEKGTFSRSSNVGLNTSMYGFVLDGVNGNRFNENSLELSDNFDTNTESEAVCIVVKEGGRNFFHLFRNEFINNNNNPYSIKIADGVNNRWNRFTSFYEGAQMEDLSKNRDNYLIDMQDGTKTEWHPVANFNATADAFDDAGGNIVIDKPYKFQQRFSDARVASISDADGAFTAKGIDLNNYAIGVKVDASIVKKFKVSATGADHRFYIKAFDNLGAELDDTGNQLTYNINSQSMAYSSIFGGSFQEAAPDSGGNVFTVTDEVDTMTILCFSNGGEIENFEIKSFIEQATIIYD